MYQLILELYGAYVHLQELTRSNCNKFPFAINEQYRDILDKETPVYKRTIKNSIHCPECSDAPLCIPLHTRNDITTSRGNTKYRK